MTTEQNKSPPYKPAHGYYHDFQGVDYPINPPCVFRSATGTLYSQQYVSAARELEQAAMDISRQRDELLEVCEEFVRKVEAGEARSIRSYQQMKAAIANARGQQ